MNPLHFHRNAKQGKTRKTPRLNGEVSQKAEDVRLSHFAKQNVTTQSRNAIFIARVENTPIENMRDTSLQRGPTSFPSLSSNKKVFSYLDANRAQNRQVIQQSWRKAQGKKKRLSPTPIPDKRNYAYAKTLSESFVNLIMVDGKKSKAEKIFSETLKKLANHLQSDKKREITLFDKRKDNVSFSNKVGETTTLFASERDVAHRGSLYPQHRGDSLYTKYGGDNTQGSLLILKNIVEKKSVHHLLQKAVNNVKPTLQVRKVRVARSIHQVPFIMKRRRQERSAIRWIIESAKKKGRYSGSSFSMCLAQTVLEAFMRQGQVREKRDQLHRTAEANRTFLRYRWW